MLKLAHCALFSVAMCGLVIRKNFSVLQRLQRFVRFVYGFALAMIFHSTVNSLFSSFSFHRCLLGSVSFLLFTCLNDVWWFRYLSLNWSAVRSMYVSWRLVLSLWPGTRLIYMSSQMKTNDSILYTPIFRLRTRVFIRLNYSRPARVIPFSQVSNKTAMHAHVLQ